MPHHVTAAQSVEAPAGDAAVFETDDDDTLLVDADAFLISQSGGNGAVLNGPWTATINGQLEAFDFGDGISGLVVQSNTLADVSNITVGQSGDVYGGFYGIELKGGAKGTVTNLGAISSSWEGIHASSSLASVTIDNSGLIQGDNRAALELDSGLCTVINRGTITGHNALLAPDAASTASWSIRNSGVIEGVFGISLAATGIHTIVNSGTIRSTISNSLSIATRGATHVTNSGTLEGDVFFGDDADTLTNSGKILGDISFRNGANTATNLGTITGDVSFGDGANSATNSGTITGDVSFGHVASTLLNSGKILGDVSFLGGANTLTNLSTITGDVSFGDDDDNFTDFRKVGKVIKDGTVSGLIDLKGGADHFNGGATNEKVTDSSGDDTYNLGGGNDYYIATSASGGFDIVNGGSGIDTYDASAATHQVLIFLGQGETFGSDIGEDKISGFEIVIGGSGNDTLSGDGAANTLIGGLGADLLTGFGGRDILTGGGDDNDTFIFTKLSDSGTDASTRDVITDFVGGGQDLIDLSAIDANGALAGDPAFSFIGRAYFSHTEGELRETFSGGNAILSGDVNGDGKADFSILLKGHVLLHDFDIVP